MNPSRRGLLQGLLGAGLAGIVPAKAIARPGARVAIVGGGFAGATCARVLRRVLPGVQVTLFEPAPRALTGPMCNAVATGLRSAAATTRTLDALRAEGITVVPQAVRAIDPVALRVQAADGRWHTADRLVVAPGIALRHDHIEGLTPASAARFPHGWLGDASLETFRARFAALGDGATVVIAPPANPYRCPPGPYERASLCAWALTRRHRGIKVLVADAKDDFSKRTLFQLGWAQHVPGVVEWIPRAQGGEVVAVDPSDGSVRLANGERVAADLACVIPPQRAADLCRDAGLVDDSGWCPVHAETFASTRVDGVHVIGDAAIALPMPKSAFAANSQAKLCALAIAAALDGRSPPSATLVNTCYSLVTPGHGISVSGVYAAREGRLSALNEGTSPLDGDAALRAREAVDANDVYASLVRDSFG